MAKGFRLVQQALITRYVLMRPFLALLSGQLAQQFPTPRGYFPLQGKHLFNVVAVEIHLNKSRMQ